MKLASMILILIVIQGVVMIYDQVYDPDDPLGLIEGYGDNETSVWDFVQDPTPWNSTVLIAGLIGLGIIATGFIVAGIFFNTPSDTAFFGPVFTLLIAVGMVPILSLRNVFVRNAATFGCDTLACPQATIAWIFTGGIIGIFYILSVLEWWSGRSTG